MSSPTATLSPLSIEEINQLSEADFVSHFGPIFEHSPWIARQTWPRRPFTSRADLLARLVATLRHAPPAQQLALIQAHPDLAGRLARQGRLTSDSTAEQASAGLDQLNADELRHFEACNQQYRDKFGFPFIICARLSDKRSILLAFHRRLLLTREAEIETALDEIEKIAALRLAPLVLP
jgi:2-oxo-4-hydroxy-4-carboxy-5-ureidoimidazoline decarboxylase